MTVPAPCRGKRGWDWPWPKRGTPLLAAEGERVGDRKFMADGFWLLSETGVEGLIGEMRGCRLAEGEWEFGRAAVWKGTGHRLGQFGDLPCDVEGSGTAHWCWCQLAGWKFLFPS